MVIVEEEANKVIKESRLSSRQQQKPVQPDPDVVEVDTRPFLTRSAAAAVGDENKGDHQTKKVFLRTSFVKVGFFCFQFLHPYN